MFYRLRHLLKSTHVVKNNQTFFIVCLYLHMVTFIKRTTFVVTSKHSNSYLKLNNVICFKCVSYFWLLLTLGGSSYFSIWEGSWGACMTPPKISRTTSARDLKFGPLIHLHKTRHLTPVSIRLPV